MKVSKIGLPYDELANRILGPNSFNLVDKFLSRSDCKFALEAWEEYSKSLYKDLLVLIPHWVSNQTICYINATDLLEGFN